MGCHREIQKVVKLGVAEKRWAAELALCNFKIIYRPGRVNGNADALSRVPDGNCAKEIRHADELAEIQLENISVRQSTSVPVEMRGLVTICTFQEQVSTSSPGTTLTSLPSLGPCELREMQIADPIISRLYYYRQHIRKPTPQERRGETRDVVTLLNQWGKIEEENGILY